MAQKRIINEITAKETAEKINILKAKTDLKAIIAAENPDTTKWKIEEIGTRIKAIETILQVRK